MQKKLLIASGLIGALICAPAFADRDKDEREYRGSDKSEYRGYDKGKYKEHMEKRHQMNMDMMEAIKETMVILRDINHTPSSADKDRLNDMIQRMERIMDEHSKMGKQMMERAESRQEKMDDRHDRMLKDDRYRDDDRR